MLPAISAFLLRSVLRTARIRWMIRRTVCWGPSRRTVTLASMDTRVSSEIQSHLTRSRRGILAIWVLRSEKNLFWCQCKVATEGPDGEAARFV